MAFTTVTVTGTAETPSGVVIPNAVISFNLDEGMVNSSVEAAGTQAIAGSDGTFSIQVKATDDSGTAAVSGGTPYYHVSIQDPISGEHVQDFYCPVPHATTPTTLTALLALAT